MTDALPVLAASLGYFKGMMAAEDPFL